MSHSTPLLGPYFSPINSPWAINILAHGLLLVAHEILIKPHGIGNSLFLAIDSACFLKLVDEVQLADDEIGENQFSEYDEDGLYPEIDAIMDSESDQDEHDE